jgi:hypothetical protein
LVCVVIANVDYAQRPAGAERKGVAMPHEIGAKSASVIPPRSSSGLDVFRGRRRVATPRVDSQLFHRTHDERLDQLCRSLAPLHALLRQVGTPRASPGRDFGRRAHPRAARR